MYDKAEQDRKSKEREFSIGEEVLVQNFRGEPKWLEATVVERMGPVSYKTQISEQVWKRHVDQMRNKSYNHTPDTRVNAPKPIVPNQNYEMPSPESLPKNCEVEEREKNKARAHTAAGQTARAQTHPQTQTNPLVTLVVTVSLQFV